jgi:hypothetical protein
MITPERVLEAGGEELRIWCARLAGYDKFYRFCGGMMLDAEVKPEEAYRRDSGVPSYDDSLDAIWPLQEKTIEKVGDQFFIALEFVVYWVDLRQPCERWNLAPEFYRFEDGTVAQKIAKVMVTASALDRARACLIARCSELESETPVKVQSAEGGGK